MFDRAAAAAAAVTTTTKAGKEEDGVAPGVMEESKKARVEKARL